MFIVICTVVLFCSWGYLIWSNWESNKLIRFPPYGFDTCPIGYVLNESQMCEPKKDYTNFVKNKKAPTSVRPILPENTNGKTVCDLWETVQSESGSLIWDAIPNKYSHKNPNNNEMFDVLNKCCKDGNKSCNNLKFSRLIGMNDLTIEDEEKEE